MPGLTDFPESNASRDQLQCRYLAQECERCVPSSPAYITSIAFVTEVSPFLGADEMTHRIGNPRSK